MKPTTYTCSANQKPASLTTPSDKSSTKTTTRTAERKQGKINNSSSSPCTYQTYQVEFRPPEGQSSTGRGGQVQTQDQPSQEASPQPPQPSPKSSHSQPAKPVSEQESVQQSPQGCGLTPQKVNVPFPIRSLVRRRRPATRRRATAVNTRDEQLARQAEEP